MFSLKCDWCVAGVFFSRISGAEVEMRVRPGDVVILYCDCVWVQGINLVWIRNSSHEHQPPLIISPGNLALSTFSRYTFVWNRFNKTRDLLVKNITESDLGLYYCVLHERTRSTEDKTTGSVWKDVYHYGNRTTRLSLLGKEFGRAHV